MDLCRSDCDRASPPLVVGVDLDQKWIITGNEVIMWQSHPLIEAHVCRSWRAVVGLYKKQTRCCMWGADSVQSKLDRISRNKTVYLQVAGMLSSDHNWALCTNCHEFKFVVRIRLKWIDPVSYEVD